MKFGIDQLNKATPKLIVRLQMSVTYIGLGIIAFTGFFCRNFGIDPIDFTEGIGIACLGVNGLAVFFGEKPIKTENE